jgi:hypothetical protein
MNRTGGESKNEFGYVWNRIQRVLKTYQYNDDDAYQERLVRCK